MRRCNIKCAHKPDVHDCGICSDKVAFICMPLCKTCQADTCMCPIYNRIDICEAWYLYLNGYYWGQGDPMYARLCRLLEYFNPRDSLRDMDDLTSNGKKIYLQLIKGGRPESHW